MLGTEVKRNVNVNKSLKETTFNVNVSNKKVLQVEFLIDKFKKIGCDDADKCYYFFRKCFDNLSESTIWSIYENSTHNPKVKSPIKYFIGACRNQMR